MTKKVSQGILTFVTLWLNCSAGHAEDFREVRLCDICGVYSQLELYEETSDIGGLELTIVKGLEGHYAMFQMAEGQQNNPLIVELIIEGSKIRFTIPTQLYLEPDVFIGEICQDAIIGKWGKQSYVLRKGKSLWERRIKLNSERYAHIGEVLLCDLCGTYSNMHFNRETGDLSGLEIVIVKGFDGVYAMVQLAQGEAPAPLIVNLNLKGNKFRFKVPWLTQEVSLFRGEILRDRIVGEFAKTGACVVLEKGRSIWEKPIER